jgi:DNA-binding SARP family transcriptional activator
LSIGLQVRAFGRVAVLRDGRAVPVLSAKALELLCYLLLHRGRAHTRDALSRLLWPDAPESQARKYLRQTLWQLQTTLAGGSVADTPPLLDVQAGQVRLNPAASVWCDVDAVEQTTRRCADVAPAALTEADVTALEHAAALCQGDLLEGWNQDWCVRERDRLHLLHLGLLERLTDHCVASGAAVRGLAHGNRLLQLDPAREVTHRQLMRLYAVAGDRTGAMRQYRRCVEALATEFDLEPDAETVHLYGQIRSGCGVVAPVGAAARAVPTVRNLGQRLDEITAALAALRSEVRLLASLQRDAAPGAEGEWEAG